MKRAVQTLAVGGILGVGTLWFMRGDPATRVGPPSESPGSVHASPTAEPIEAGVHSEHVGAKNRAEGFAPADGVTRDPGASSSPPDPGRGYGGFPDDWSDGLEAPSHLDPIQRQTYYEELLRSEGRAIKAYGNALRLLREQAAASDEVRDVEIALMVSRERALLLERRLAVAQ
jgi:hypothetical protein